MQSVPHKHACLMGHGKILIEEYKNLNRGLAWTSLGILFYFGRNFTILLRLVSHPRAQMVPLCLSLPECWNYSQVSGSAWVLNMSL